MNSVESESSGADKPGFATTHWSLVAAAGDLEGERARGALEDLCSRYWYPLYAWLRRSGDGHDDAQDLVQAFLMELIEHRRLALADRERGRFRSFLLASLKNFRANNYRRESSQKRGGGKSHLSIDFSGAADTYSCEPYHDLTPDTLYDRKWALQLIERSMQKLEASARERGRESLFDSVRPVLSGVGNESGYQEIADQLDMSVGAVKVAVHRWREQLRATIREEIRQTVATDDEVDGELDHLFRILAGGG